MTKDKKVVTDFRHLNMHIAKKYLAYPLLKDTFLMLGSSKCEVMSVLDLKDAFHSLQLMENSKKFCGILPYFGSPSYLYQRMPIGLNISPTIWQSYINAILSCLQSRKHCEAIMDDLLLFTSMKSSHFDKLEDLLRALHKNGLKISLKKCQLLKTDLQYMGNTIFIRNKRVCIRPLRNWIETIQKLKPPTTIKGCRSFAGMVNFVSIFCLELQKLLKPYMTSLGKEDSLFGEKNNKRPLMKSNIDYKDPQFYIYPTDMDDFNYILAPASLPLVVHCTRFRMDSQGSLPMQVRECQRKLRTILLQS